MKCSKCEHELEFQEKGVIRNNIVEQKVVSETDIYKCNNPDCEDYGKTIVIPTGLHN